jgi:hypothetical protein
MSSVEADCISGASIYVDDGMLLEPAAERGRTTVADAFQPTWKPLPGHWSAICGL